MTAGKGMMVASLLKTKLYIPSLRTELVSRPRLIDRLNAGLHCKLTLVSAPAGFGKTTLLSEWIHNVETQNPASLPDAAPPRIAWVSLDKGDNDPARFWAYCIGALQRVQPGIGEIALAALQSRQPPSAEALLTGLINEIAPIQHPLVLVLDDFHVITDQQVHGGVTFLLDNLPPQMHVIVSSRADPPWSLARRRARGELNELRASDLRFNPEEAAAFLNDVMGLGLSAEDVATLDARTEGWIAGLQMAALTMRGRKDVAAFIKTFSGVHRFILDYLVEEVLDQQSPAIRGFLLQTSILERLSGSLCDAVTRGDESQAILIQLERANLFLVPLDDERRWYRYHHLFADLLRGRLEQSPPSVPPACGGDETGSVPACGGDETGSVPAGGGDERGGVPASGGDERGSVPAGGGDETGGMPAGGGDRAGVATLHRRASEWYEQNGLIVEAMSHALAAGDIDRVASLVAGNAFAMMDHGGLMTLVGWLDALPDEVVRSRPWLSVSHAWALAYAGHLDAVEPVLQVAEEALRILGETTSVEAGSAVWADTEGPALNAVGGQRIAGHIAAIRGYAVYIRGDLSRSEELTRRALDCLPEEDLRARGLPTALLGSVLKWTGDLAAAAQVSTEAVAISKATGDGHVAVHAACDLAGLRIMQGRLHEAIGDCRDALQIADTYVGRGGQQLPVAGHAYAFMSAVLLERNELEAALRNAREGLELCKLCGQADVLTSGYRSLAVVLQALGDGDGALSAIREAREVAASVSPWYASEAAAWEARLWLAQGRLAAAARWVQENGLSVDDDVSFQTEYQYRTLARVFIAQGRAAEALGLLTRLLGVEEEAGAMGRVIEILVLQALALDTQGEVEHAMTTLEGALILAEPQGYVRTFVGEGAAMGRLLRQAAASGVAVDYVTRLLAQLEKETKDEAPTKDEGRRTAPISSSFVLRPSSSVAEPLSERELEVLRLLRTNLSSPEIAEQLFVAPSTVRSHTKSIYGKLDVHSRREAVERAKELGLL